MGAGTISEMKNLECITLFVGLRLKNLTCQLPEKGTDFRPRPPMQQNQ
jgi:hypothetical protein